MCGEKELALDMHPTQLEVDDAGPLSEQLADLRSQEKSVSDKRKLQALSYERQAVAAYQQDFPGSEVWHWGDVPEQVLYDCGWLRPGHRKRRLNDGGFQEYGLDGVARNPDGSYCGIQCKCYGSNSWITASSLGTFSLVVQADIQPANEAKQVFANPAGILYHTPEAKFEQKLDSTFEDDFSKINQAVFHLFRGQSFDKDGSLS